MRLIALLAAAALLLAGCGAADPVPKVPKQSASATPTATLPVMPAEAQKDSKAGAIAFVKHYIEVFNYASNTGDVKELKQLSDPKCEGCNSYINTIEASTRDDAKIRKFRWSPRSIEFQSISSIQTGIDSDSYETRDSSRDSWKRVLPAKYQLSFALATRGNARVVKEIYLNSEGDS